MKRLFVLGLALIVLLCGCNKSNNQSQEDDLIVIGISQVGAESDWRVANSESMKSVFTEENGYRLLFEDARQTQENQIIAVRKFIQQQVDYIILLPIYETGWDSVLQEARDANIPVILVDRMATVTDETLYLAHVGSDVYDQGSKAVQWLEETYNNTPINIIHIQGTLGSTPQIGRTKALENGVAKHENWQILTQMDGDFTRAKTYEILCSYLDSLEPEMPIDIVYCENDNEAFGAIEALEEHGYVCGEDVDIICFDGTRGALELCLAGKIAMVVESNPMLGPLVEEIIQEKEAGKTPEKHYYIYEQWYTEDKISEEMIAERLY